jgi:hypothetical protein
MKVSVEFIEPTRKEKIKRLIKKLNLKLFILLAILFWIIVYIVFIKNAIRWDNESYNKAQARYGTVEDRSPEQLYP